MLASPGTHQVHFPLLRHGVFVKLKEMESEKTYVTIKLALGTNFRSFSDSPKYSWLNTFLGKF